jgi:adenylate cyclase
MGTDTNTKICSECGTENSVTARFCHQCATPFGESVASTAEAAERKQVTVLFADLTGFTALTEKLDPEETRQIMGSIFERAAGIVQRYDGRIEKFVGDAIMAAVESLDSDPPRFETDK